jgi:cell division transport system ATP-binding protein
MLRLQHVAMRYGDGPEVLCDLNLTLGPGEFVFVIGPNGAGKTSLLRLLGLLHRPCAGNLILFGEDVAQLSQDRRAALRRRIGVVFQDVRLLDHLSVFENAALPLRIAGGSDEQIEGFVAEMLASVGLGGMVAARPATLSMGQRQLVNVARAVIARPSLLLCDEPTAHIDDKLVRRLLHLFTRLSKLGTAIVMTTRSADLVEQSQHPVLRLAGGRLRRLAAVSSATAAAD